MSDEMRTGQRHFDEELQEALDARLAPEAAAEVEAHLGTCPECRLRFERLRAAKRAVAALGQPPLPDGLAERIASALDREALQAAPPSMPPRTAIRRPLFRVLLAVAALLVVALLGALALRERASALPRAVARDFASLKRGATPPEIRTADTRELEAFFASRRLGFAVRVLELRMMGWEVSGGGVRNRKDGTSAYWIYRDAAGRLLVCEMYRGLARDVARGAGVRVHEGISFYVHQVSDVTLAFWQEGDVACVLASDIGPEEVVSLAFAKAMLPAAALRRTPASVVGAAVERPGPLRSTIR